LERRQTEVELQPIGLVDAFTKDAAKLSQWRGFIRKNKLQAPDLLDVVEELKGFLLPVLTGSVGGRHWAGGGPWQ
jgi:hypothetical protein